MVFPMELGPGHLHGSVLVPGEGAVIPERKILSVPAAAVTVSLASGGFAP